MITIKEGNLFNASEGYICHQVNCHGTMGRGIAAQFKRHYPMVEIKYKKLCKEHTSTDLLGTCLFMDNTICMFAQEGYGYGGQYTEYWAFRTCCTKIVYYLNKHNKKDAIINMPYGIGCGLGGADWDHIYTILEEEFKDYNVILWKLK